MYNSGATNYIIQLLFVNKTMEKSEKMNFFFRFHSHRILF